MSDLLNNDGNAKLVEARENLAAQVQKIVKESNADLNEVVTETKDSNVTANISEDMTQDAPVLSEAEKKARELGWLSKEERTAMGKDNAHFVEPDEYVRRQPLFEKIAQQRKEAEEAKAMAKQAMDTLIQLRKEGYEERKRQLEAAKEQTIDDGDRIQYNALKVQQQALAAQEARDPIINQPAPAPVKDPDVSAFEQRNSSWFNRNTVENQRMCAAAKAVDTYLVEEAAIAQGITSEQMEQGARPVIDRRLHLAAIEAEIKKQFPSRFAQTQQNASVGRSTTATGTSTSTNLASRLSVQQLAIGKRLVQGGHSLEDYAKELDKMGRLAK